jgi:hypothetical protein
MSSLELMAYVIIGLAAFLFFGGIFFVLSLHAYSAWSDWRVERAVRASRADPRRAR